MRTRQEEVDHKEEVLAVLLERYAAAGSSPEAAPGRSHPNLGLLGLTRQASMTAPSKASLAAPHPKATPTRQTAGDVKRLGSSRGTLDVKVSPTIALLLVPAAFVCCARACCAVLSRESAHQASFTSDQCLTGQRFSMCAVLMIYGLALIHRP